MVLPRHLVVSTTSCRRAPCARPLHMCTDGEDHVKGAYRVWPDSTRVISANRWNSSFWSLSKDCHCSVLSTPAPARGNAAVQKRGAQKRPLCARAIELAKCP